MRREGDFYETADWQVDALTDNLPELLDGSVWCPCVGDGSLLRRLAHNRPTIGSYLTNDIDEARDAHCHLDATKWSSWVAMFYRNGARWPDWVVENPPFDREIEILEHAYRVARCGVVFMSRLSFVEGTKPFKPRKDGKPRKDADRERPRGPWLEAHPHDKRIVLERYSFTGNGRSDSATTEWLVWAKVPIARPFGVTAYGYKDGTVVRPSLAGVR